MPIELVELRSVCIICDSVLKDRVLKEIIKLGATGYTWWEVHGRGEHDTETNIFSGLVRLKIEAWCSVAVAEKILAYCQASQFRELGMSAAVTTIRVHPDEAAKYGAT